MDLRDLKKTLDQLNRDAFGLAQAAAADTGGKASRGRRARAMNNRLDELIPFVQSAPPEDQAGLIQAWNDARLDLGYVLSGGELPTSTRLFHYLQDVKQSEESAASGTKPAAEG